MSEILVKCSDVSTINWEDCEPSIENFWENIKIADAMHSLQISLMLGEYYFAFNKDKGYNDYESELRSHGLSMGLIAEKVSDNERIQEMITSGKGLIIKKELVDEYLQKKNDTDFDVTKYIAEYSVIFSCHPRDQVVEETLKHSESMEENLLKLEQTGVFISSESTSEDTPTVPDDQLSLPELVALGKKKMIVTSVNPQEEFEKDHSNYPDLEPVQIGVDKGLAVFGLVKDKQLVSSYGFEMGTTTIDDKEQKFLNFRAIR